LLEKNGKILKKEPVPKLEKPVGRKGLEGREAAAQAAEPPESPVCGVLRRKCAKIPNRSEITNEFWNRLK
jgi:hypothetical protein